MLTLGRKSDLDLEGVSHDGLKRFIVSSSESGN